MPHAQPGADQRHTAGQAQRDHHFRLCAAVHRLWLQELHVPLPAPSRRTRTAPRELRLGAHLRRVHQDRRLRHHPRELLPVPHHGPHEHADDGRVHRLPLHVRLRHHGAQPARFQAPAGLPQHLADRLYPHGAGPLHRHRHRRRPLPRHQPHALQGPALPGGRQRALRHGHDLSGEAGRAGAENAADGGPLPGGRLLHQRHPALQRLRLQVDDLPGDVREGGGDRQHRLCPGDCRLRGNQRADARLLRQSGAVRVLRAAPAGV